MTTLVRAATAPALEIAASHDEEARLRVDVAVRPRLIGPVMSLLPRRLLACHTRKTRRRRHPFGYVRTVTKRPVLAFTDRGSGPTLIFVHGFLNQASVWDGVADELAEVFRCIAIDLPGHGKSSATGAGTYARDDVLNDIRAVLRETDTEQAVFVGHSLGGYLSLALAIESPELVEGLGLIGAGPGFRNPASREKWNDSVRTLVAERDLPDGLEEISMHVDAMVMDGLSDIEVPTAVVVGERDKGFLASAAVFEKNLNVVAHEVVTGAGHMVHAKAPAAVAAVLRSTFGRN